MAMGIWGLLLKEYAPEALLDCLRQVISGEKWLPAELVSKAAHAPQDSGERKIELLTRREREITELICGGLSNRCIADTLGTSEGTITVHLHNIRSEEHTSELQSLMRISYAVFCLKKKKKQNKIRNHEIKSKKNTHTKQT